MEDLVKFLLFALAGTWIFMFYLKSTVEEDLHSIANQAMEVCKNYAAKAESSASRILDSWFSAFRCEVKDAINDVREGNPYHPRTQVLVFSQGSEADDWMQTNCDKCTKSATCPLRYDILHSSDPYYCKIPLCSAKRIGMDYEALYRSGNLYWRCLEFDNGRDTELNF